MANIPKISILIFLFLIIIFNKESKSDDTCLDLTNTKSRLPSKAVTTKNVT